MLNNQLSSSQINETLLNAMKEIARKEVQNLEFDITEKYTILEKTKDSTTNEDCYIIKINGTKMYVYAINEEEYQPQDIVLVNIPKGDYTEKKYIIGLANDSHIKKYFLPDSNFVPVFRMALEEITDYQYKKNGNFIEIFQNKMTTEQFKISDSIYLSCEFKVLNKWLDYDFGLKITITYLNGEVQFLYFKDIEFIGNYNEPYFFKQDICFNFIPKFQDILSIGVSFDCPIKNKNFDFINDIRLRNLRMDIGKTIDTTNTGVEIVCVPNTLTYNDNENDFTRSLGLIWYNRNDEGDFIGFDTGLSVTDRKTIIGDQYAYKKEKTIFDERYELYSTGTCPKDIDGLDYIRDINNLEKDLSELNKVFLEKNSYANGQFIKLKNAYDSLIKLIEPQSITSVTLDQNVLEISYGIILNNYYEIEQNFEQLIDRQSTAYNDVNSLYYTWSNFMANIFYNTRKMQDLEKNIDNLELVMPIDSIIMKQVSLEEIFNYISQQFQSQEQEYKVNGISNTIQYMIVNLEEYQKQCVQYLNLSEKELSNWEEKIKKYVDILNEVYMELRSTTIFLTGGSYKKANESLNKMIEKYSQYLSNDIIVNFDYTTNDSYYNMYYYKYKNFDFNNDTATFDSIIENDKIFKTEFKYSGEIEEQDTMAIYWYEEDLTNEEVDELLEEQYWTRINIEDNIYATFPTTYKKSLILTDETEYFHKATPYENMLPVTLPRNLQTKTYKVQVYYNYEFQGEQTITFKNAQYQDIGFESTNTNLDLEYADDVYSLNIGSQDYLPLHIFCYNLDSGRELITSIEKPTTSKAFSNYPVLQVFPAVFENVHKTMTLNLEKNDLIEFQTGRKGEIVVGFRPNAVNEYPIYHGVYCFKLWHDQETTSTAYFPLAWCEGSSALSLEGVKMIKLDDEGRIIYDAYDNELKTGPKIYNMVGEKNIKNVQYSIIYYDKAGTIVSTIAQDRVYVEKEYHLFTINYDEQNNATLKCHLDKARKCLSYYRPTLKVTGTFGDNDTEFTYYQSLFMQHPDYNPETWQFAIDETKAAHEAAKKIASVYNIIDPNEQAFIEDLRKNIEQFGAHYTCYVPKLEKKYRDAAIKDLKKILQEDGELYTAYTYLFNDGETKRKKEAVLVHQLPTRAEMQEMLALVEQDPKNWTTTKTYTVYSFQKEKRESTSANINSWVETFFKELVRIYGNYEDNLEEFQSYINITYDQYSLLADYLAAVEKEKKEE